MNIFKFFTERSVDNIKKLLSILIFISLLFSITGCKKEPKKSLGITGRYEKDWHYCEEHYMIAKTQRDHFLVDKGLTIYDRTPTEKEYYEKHCSEH